MNNKVKLTKREQRVRADAAIRLQELTENYEREEAKLSHLDGEDLDKQKEHLKEITDEVIKLNIFFI